MNLLPIREEAKFSPSPKFSQWTKFSHSLPRLFGKPSFGPKGYTTKPMATPWGNRSRVVGDKGTKYIGPRTYVLDASVDQTEAGKEKSLGSAIRPELAVEKPGRLGDSELHIGRFNVINGA